MITATTRAMAEQCESTSKVLKALAHPQRLLLLCHLSEKDHTVSELESLCEASQSLLSQFLQRMKSEGLVESRREGKFVYYSIANPKILKLVRALHKIFCP
jgi:DNA-binding transcriptional ArsR family regulator